MTTHLRRRSLYICYLSLDDPLVHSQVVAYLRGLAAAGHRIHLLTFDVARRGRSERRHLRQSLAADGIRWHSLRYHKAPSLPATVYDTWAGAVAAAVLVRRHRLDTLHARNHVPAAMAMIVQGLLRSRRPELIFDIRGLMAEEYEDAGRWHPGSLPSRLTKAVERGAIARAAGIVVLTARLRERLFGRDHSPHVQVIPCCADLEMLSVSTETRPAIRAQLGLTDATVMIYVGKFSGWYMAAEMAEFFCSARGSIPNLKFLILTQAEAEEIRSELARRGVKDGFTITSAPHEQIGSYLAAADFGISFIRPTPSKISSSPTKIGEYLGAGLPVVCTSGVGDLDELINPQVGALITEHTADSYAAAADHVAHLLTRTGTSERCRELARRELSLRDIGIPRYEQLYEASRPIETR